MMALHQNLALPDSNIGTLKIEISKLDIIELVYKLSSLCNSPCVTSGGAIQ